jgi:hypothetical protein
LVIRSSLETALPSDRLGERIELFMVDEFPRTTGTRPSGLTGLMLRNAGLEVDRAADVEPARFVAEDIDEVRRHRKEWLPDEDSNLEPSG